MYWYLRRTFSKTGPKPLNKARGKEIEKVKRNVRYVAPLSLLKDVELDSSIFVGPLRCQCVQPPVTPEPCRSRVSLGPPELSVICAGAVVGGVPAPPPVRPLRSQSHTGRPHFWTWAGLWKDAVPPLTTKGVGEPPFCLVQTPDVLTKLPNQCRPLTKRKPSYFQNSASPSSIALGRGPVSGLLMSAGTSLVWDARRPSWRVIGQFWGVSWRVGGVGGDGKTKSTARIQKRKDHFSPPLVKP